MSEPKELDGIVNVKRAFTLAEVLITLAIIGVVAALTIPTVVRNYEKNQTITQLKKAYATINSALQMSQVDNGYAESWNYELSDRDFFEQYFKKYYSISKMCKYDTTTIDCFNGYNTNFLNNKEYTIYHGKNRFATKDGMIFVIEKYSVDKVFFIVDINGVKKPNVMGKDIFSFWLMPKKEGITNCGNGDIGYNIPKFGLYPDGFNIEYNNGWRHCTKDSSVNAAGYHCSAKIMKDGWQIKDDYPW